MGKYQKAHMITCHSDPRRDIAADQATAAEEFGCAVGRLTDTTDLLSDARQQYWEYFGGLTRRWVVARPPRNMTDRKSFFNKSRNLKPKAANACLSSILIFHGPFAHEMPRADMTADTLVAASSACRSSMLLLFIHYFSMPAGAPPGRKTERP